MKSPTYALFSPLLTFNQCVDCCILTLILSSGFYIIDTTLSSSPFAVLGFIAHYQPPITNLYASKLFTVLFISISPLPVFLCSTTEKR